MSSPVEIVLIIAAVGYILIRRLLGEPAEAKRMLLLPVVLGAIGFSDVQSTLHDPLQVVFLVGTVFASMVFGLLRGASIRVGQRDGIVFMQYTAITIGVWVANFVVKFGANFALSALDPHSGAGNTLLLTVGVGMLIEGLVVLAKAMRTDGQVIWSKGKDGQPHQSAAFLDELQNRMRDRRS